MAPVFLLQPQRILHLILHDLIPNSDFTGLCSLFSFLRCRYLSHTPGASSAGLTQLEGATIRLALVSALRNGRGEEVTEAMPTLAPVLLASLSSESEECSDVGLWFGELAEVRVTTVLESSCSTLRQPPDDSACLVFVPACGSSVC